MVLPYYSKIPQWLIAFRINSNLYNTTTNLTYARSHWALKPPLSFTFLLLLLQSISCFSSMHCFLKPPCLVIRWNAVLYIPTFTTLLFNTIFTCLTKLSSGRAAYPSANLVFLFQNTSRLSLLLRIVQVTMSFQIDYCNLHLTSVLTSTLAHPMGYPPTQQSRRHVQSYFKSYYSSTYNPSTGSKKKKKMSQWPP